MKGILTSEGEPLEDIDNVHIIIGYQAEHGITGRLLPMCTRFELYELFTLMHKMGEVATHMDECGIEFNIFEYVSVPVYEMDVVNYSYVFIDEHLA